MTKKPPNRRGITFEVGAQLEARDRLKKWYAALIEEINFEEGKVLIHFKHWNHRHDEWFCWDSPDLRPEEKIQLRTEGLHSEPVQPEFRVNQQVLACWSDCRFYPAKVTAANKDGTYTVKFFDGIVQTVKNIHVKPYSKDQNLACAKPKERSKDISLRIQKKREEQRSSTEINRNDKDEQSQNIDKSQDPDKPVVSDTSKQEHDTDKSISVSEGQSKKDSDKDKLFATAEERKKDPENQNVISRTDCEKQKCNAISEEHKIPDMYLPNTEKEDKENILNDNDTLIDKHLEVKKINSHRAPGNRGKRSRQQSSSSADPASQTLQPIFLTLRRRKISISVAVQSKRSRLEKNLHGLPSIHVDKPTTSSHNIQRRKKRNMSFDGQEKVKVPRRSSRLSSADIQKTTEVVHAPSTAEVVGAWLESASSSKEPHQDDPSADNAEKLPKSSNSVLGKVKMRKSQAHHEKLQIPRRSSRLSSCTMPEMTEVLHLPGKVESLKEHSSSTQESPQDKHIETVLDIQTEETLIDFSGKIKTKQKPGRSTKRSSNSMQEMVDIIHITLGPTVTHPLNDQPSSPKQPPQEEVRIPQPSVQSEEKSSSLSEFSEKTQFMRTASQQSSNTSLEIIDEVFVTSALSVKHNLKEQTTIQKKPPEFTQECLCDQISFMETKQFLHVDEPYEISGMEINSTTIEGKPESIALEGKPERKALDETTESNAREDENENQSLARKTESKAIEDDKESQTLERKTENKAEVQSESEALEGRTESEALVGQFESKADEGTTESEALEAKTEGGDVEVKTERAAVKGKTELHGVEQKTHCEEVERKTECEAGGERTGSKAVEVKIDSVAADAKTESTKCLKPNDGKATTALQVTTLRRHGELLTCKVLTSELDRSKFKCKIKDCSKFFRKAKLLHYHMKYFHGVEKTEQVQKSVTRTIQTRGSLANEKAIQEIPKRRRTTSGSLNIPLPLELRCSHSDVKTEKQNEKKRHSVPSSDTLNTHHPLLRDKSKDNHLNKYHRKQPDREKQHDYVLKDKKSKEKKSKDLLKFKAKKKKKKRKKSKPELLGSEENSEIAQELSPKKLPTSIKPHPALRTPYCQEKVPLQSSDTWPIKDQLKKNEEDTLSDSSADSLLWSEDEYSQEIDVTTNPEEAVDEDERDFEIVRCMCEVQEENNFMIQVRTVDPDKLSKRLHFQCEECLCWQHGVCMGLVEDNVPEKYTCFICQNPPGQRSGLKYWYDKEWLKNGHLHGLSFLEENYSHQNAKKIIATHQLLGDVHCVIELLHGLQLKMSVLQNKDHPDLKLWCLPWKQLTVDNKCHARRFHPDICGKEDSTNYRTFNGALERPSVPSVEESYITSEHCYQKPRAYYPAIEQRLVVETRGSAMDDGVNRVRENGDDAIAQMLGWELDRDKNMMERDSKHNYCKVREHAPKKSSPGEVLQMKLMDNIGDGVLNTQLQWKLNLINHVESLQDEVTHRMDFIEKELDVLESFLDYTGELEPPEPLARLPQLKHRVKQLLLDLGKVQQIALCCSTCV